MRISMEGILSNRRTIVTTGIAAAFLAATAGCGVKGSEKGTIKEGWGGIATAAATGPAAPAVPQGQGEVAAATRILVKGMVGQDVLSAQSMLASVGCTPADMVPAGNFLEKTTESSLRFKRNLGATNPNVLQEGGAVSPEAIGPLTLAALGKAITDKVTNCYEPAARPAAALAPVPAPTTARPFDYLTGKAPTGGSMSVCGLNSIAEGATCQIPVTPAPGRNR
ncbi:hypothetical protein IPL85_00555 [Candidatus Saccharibacteria bacterium]|nr:MAG: hypothetical protein IPL85_00555 [Candidatus Saccharibacteria bacterium]